MVKPKANILVADDERNIRKTLAIVLAAEGYTVDQARDGEDALELCKERHPDIAFVDLHMPRLGGLEVLARIRVLSPKTAVVIITAYGSAAKATEAMKLGAVDFIEKPFDPKTIGILAKEIILRQEIDPKGSFDDYIHLADLAEQRGAHLEARAYLKQAMLLSAQRPEPYWRLGVLWEKDGDKQLATQYYYMALSADHSFELAEAALKRLGKLH